MKPTYKNHARSDGAGMPAGKVAQLSEVTAPAKQSDQADNDQINGDNVVQQTRHSQNQDAGNQRNQRSDE